MTVSAFTVPGSSYACNTPRSLTMRERRLSGNARGGSNRSTVPVRGRAGGAHGARHSYVFSVRRSWNSIWYAPRSDGSRTNTTTPAVIRSSRCAGVIASSPYASRRRISAVSRYHMPRGVVARKCGLSTTMIPASSYTTSKSNGICGSSTTYR